MNYRKPNGGSLTGKGSKKVHELFQTLIAGAPQRKMPRILGVPGVFSEFQLVEMLTWSNCHFTQIVTLLSDQMEEIISLREAR